MMASVRKALCLCRSSLQALCEWACVSHLTLRDFFYYFVQSTSVTSSLYSFFLVLVFSLVFSGFPCAWAKR